jgi:hypothetical protein
MTISVRMRRVWVYRVEAVSMPRSQALQSGWTDAKPAEAGTPYTGS